MIYSGGAVFGAGRRHPDGSYVHVYSKLYVPGELVLEPIRHDIYAEWSDPREWLVTR